MFSALSSPRASTGCSALLCWLLKFPEGSFGAGELRESWVRTEETERLIFLYSPIKGRGRQNTRKKKSSFKMLSFLPLIIGPYVVCAHKPNFSRIKVGFL